MQIVTHEYLMQERIRRVNDAIRRMGYTYEMLERTTGIPHSTLQRYVSGTTDKIPVTFFEQIAYATHTPVEYLLCFDLQENAYVRNNKRTDFINRINSLPDPVFDQLYDRLTAYLDGLLGR